MSNSLLEIVFLLGKHQILLIDRTNQPLALPIFDIPFVNKTYSWHMFCS